ncbi:penicillin-binding protein [Metabacillus iocasae]|uniref:serine-type D-Ala-D-Ala carboxypeptidase n=1 Tax=Priestia iocasae TaxID=2291674 RepID=A0ABS2QR21_9BACI|nr:penicillin-binding protein [Metabacillus iocasae]MBM7701768.1 penicillin-binding protein 2B [Metabacillus iocasae]
MNSVQKNKNITRGAAILILIFALLFFILASRFFYIQATGKAEGEALAQIAQKKYTRQSTIEGHRGTIYDRRGEPIAHDTGAYTVVAILDENQTKNPKDPKHVTDSKKTAKQLAPLLKMEEDQLENLLEKDSFQVELGPGGRDINHELKRKIEKLELPGITFIRDAKRLYPNGVFASHILGYAQKDDTGKIVGKMGIEQVFNKQLTETDGYMKYQSARNGIKLPDPKESIVPPENGDNVYLTIDEKIQTFIEEALSRAEKEYDPEQMMAVVVNAKTGEILGMSSRPSFNPNIRDITSYGNPIVEGRYELGSTMKIFTLAAAIEEGAYNGNELYKSGSYKIPEDPRPIRDHNGGAGWGTITFDEGFRRSSNVAIAMLVNERLGTEAYLQYLERFGFTKKTEIDLPNEASSRIVSKYTRDRIATAFGQASAFSPIQQIQAATAIANEGKMMKPYVIQKVVDGTTGEVKREAEPKMVGEPISKETSQKVLDILESVVTADDGTGKPYNIEGYSVAGKTGTAQITDKNGRYQSGHGKNLFSFLGFGPADDPSLIVYVAVKKPKLPVQETGSAPTSMVFNSVMKNSLQYLKIEPEEQKEETNKSPKKVNQGAKINSYEDESITEAASILKKQGFEPVIIGKGSKVVDQSPQADEFILKGEKVLLKSEGKLNVPDLNGWSYRDVIRLSEFLDLQPSAVGNGFVMEQNIPPNGTIKKGDYLIVKLQSPEEVLKKQKEESNKKEEDKVDDEKQPLD